MEKPEEIRKEYWVVTIGKLFYVHTYKHRFTEAFTTKNKAEEYADTLAFKKFNKLYRKAFNRMRREPDINKRTKMWKELCVLKSSL